MIIKVIIVVLRKELKINFKEKKMQKFKLKKIIKIFYAIEDYVLLISSFYQRQIKISNKKNKL